MQNALEKRLAALEAAKATSRLGEGGLHDISRLMIALISFHLGAMQESEPMAQAMSRALNYGRSQDMSAGLVAEGDTSASLAFDERYRGAVERLLALRGTGFEDTSNGVSCALRSLFYAMPERIQRHRFLEGIDPAEMFEGIPEDATPGAAPLPCADCSL